MTALTPEQVLDLPMDENDAGQPTVRAYLVELLKLVWSDGEGFDGKRPFGNSGWESEVLDTLARSGAVESTLDRWGRPEYDQDGASGVIAAAIESLRIPVMSATGVWIGMDEDGDTRAYATEADALAAAGEFGRARFYAWGAQLNG
jgi:hypothetical protein